MFAALRLLISSMWHKSLAFFPALISGWVLFNLLFFPCFCMLWFSSCLANNRLSLSVFVICFRAIKQKLMNFRPSKNTMCPINPQRRSQQIINQHKPNTYTNCLFFFFALRKGMNHAGIFPQIKSRVFIFLKMQRCHQIVAVTLCYVNSVKCHTHLPLILQTKQTRLLTFLLPSVPNFDYILFPLDAVIEYEHWSYPIHNKTPRTGRQLPLQRNAWVYLSLGFLLGGWGSSSAPHHVLSVTLFLASLWSFIVTFLVFILAPIVRKVYKVQFILISLIQAHPHMRLDMDAWVGEHL